MASNDGGEERDLPPTARRLQRLREQEGQVPHSKDFESALSLIMAFIYLGANLKGIVERFKAAFSSIDYSISQGFENEAYRVLSAQAQLLVEIVVPLIAIVIGGHVLAMILDMKGFVLSFKAITPNITKLNPISGFKQLFSLQRGFNLLKAFIVLFVLGFANTYLLRYFLNDLLWSPSCGEGCILEVFVWLYGSSILIGLVLLLIVAAIDLPISRILFKRQHKMTLSELKREQKEDSGSPEIKSARRALADEIAQTAGFVGLSKADIVLAFGDQAVALTYKQGKTAAPIIAARTRADAASYIKEAALRKLPIVEEPELLARIIDEGKLGSYIPNDTFNDVARVLIQTGVVKM